ncbi:MAG: aspartyl protease family protein [Acetobacteraceae bacterium]
MALIDTGASATAISAKVIKDVGLMSIGKKPVGGVHGHRPTNLYQFQVGLVFPQSPSPTGAINANIAPFPVTGPEFVPLGPSFDILLGRDVLCHGTFSMSWDGHAVICV